MGGELVGDLALQKIIAKEVFFYDEETQCFVFGLCVLSLFYGCDAGLGN